MQWNPSQLLVQKTGWEATPLCTQKRKTFNCSLITRDKIAEKDVAEKFGWHQDIHKTKYYTTEQRGTLKNYYGN